MKLPKKPWLFRLLGRLVFCFICVYRLFVRRTDNVDKRFEGRYIIAHPHGDQILLAIGGRTKRQMAMMISQSADGEALAALVSALGHIPVRGSSSKGGSTALRNLKKLAAEKDIMLAVDGPRGPRFAVKPGVIDLARLTGLPIMPMALRCSRSYTFAKAWDKTEVPKPFSSVSVHFGEVMHIAADCKKEDYPALCEELSRRMQAAKGV